jgi:SAM-dependent methyltransferase
VAERIVHVRPWQLDMFDVSLKKRQKLRMLLDLLGPLGTERCLLVTHGDNTGALNWFLREAGGRWAWAEMETDGIAAMRALLGDEVSTARAHVLPYDDGAFDRVVAVDVHEHLRDVTLLNREIARVLASGGLAIVTTPNGDRSLPVARLKRWVGMNETRYGHVVQGYRAAELEAMATAVGLEPVRRAAYSRFFTELVELAINFGYVKVLARRRGRREPPAGHIAPRTVAQFEGVGGAYRTYRRVFPFLRAFAALDALVPGRGGYAVGIVARKPG